MDEEDLHAVANDYRARSKNQIDVQEGDRADTSNEHGRTGVSGFLDRRMDAEALTMNNIWMIPTHASKISLN